MTTQKVSIKLSNIQYIIYLYKKRDIMVSEYDWHKISILLVNAENCYMLDVGALLRGCREFSLLSQADVVKLVKIPLTQPELSAIECGKRKKVSFEKIYAIIEAMGLEMLIHEGIVVNEPSDVRKLRKEFGMTIAGLSPSVSVHKTTLSIQEREGTMRLVDFLNFTKAMGLKMVLIDDGIDMNDYKPGENEENGSIE